MSPGRISLAVGLVGAAGSTWECTAYFAAIWAAAAFCAGYCRWCAIDAIRERFWPMLRIAAAKAALPYLLPVAAAVASTCGLALAISPVRDGLAVKQLLSLKNMISSVSDLWGTWIKLDYELVFLILLGAGLATALLLTRPGSTTAHSL